MTEENKKEPNRSGSKNGEKITLKIENFEKLEAKKAEKEEKD